MNGVFLGVYGISVSAHGVRLEVHGVRLGVEGVRLEVSAPGPGPGLVRLREARGASETPRERVHGSVVV